MTGAGPSATVVLARTVRPGFDAAFEEWMLSFKEEATRFDPAVAVDLVRPHHPVHSDYLGIFRFSSPERRLHWEKSPECKAWLAKAEPMTAGSQEVHFLTRLEPWVQLPGPPLPKLPPRWKIAVLTFFALLPFVIWIVPRIPSLPLALALAVLGYAFITMPTLTRLFSWWLLQPPDRTN